MKDGGPAFPRTGNDYQAGDNHKYHPGHEGMSLRDWFAGQALAGLITNPAGIASARKAAMNSGFAEDYVLSGMAYEFADAMLKAREESK